jgi:hypothetical protein
VAAVGWGSGIACDTAEADGSDNIGKVAAAADCAGGVGTAVRSSVPPSAGVGDTGVATPPPFGGRPAPLDLTNRHAK